MPPGRIWLLISSPRPNPRAPASRIIIAQPAPRRQACLGMKRAPKNRKGGYRFGSIDFIRLFGARTRCVDGRFACAVGTRFAACSARLSASGQTGHYVQFKSWPGCKSRRLLLCRGNRCFRANVARQSERLQPRGLFTRGQTGCLVFGRCFLTVQQPLLLLFENRFGSIACLISVQRRYSFSGESTPQDRLSWGPDAVCRCADVGLVN
jgi:hypothetical protein